MVEPDERRLVQSVRAGESEAITRLFERWWRPVWGLATARVSHRAEAEQLTARIFASAFAHLGDWSGACSLDAWVLAVANAVANKTHPVGPERRGHSVVPTRSGGGRTRQA